jgi:hypothetical protein
MVLWIAWWRQSCSTWRQVIPIGLTMRRPALAKTPTARMLAAELRSRIARSRVSGKRLAELLGIPQPNVARWCTGIRPIPLHHVAAIIRLTDNPPPRTGPAWRPPADMPRGRSTGRLDSLSRQCRRRSPDVNRSDRPEPVRQPSASRASGGRVDRDRSDGVVRLDLSILNHLLFLRSGEDANRSVLRHRPPVTGPNGVWNAGSAPAAPEPASGPSPHRRPALRPVIDPAAPATPPVSLRSGEDANRSMAGPRLADFVAQENVKGQAIDEGALMLMRFFER